MNQHDHLVRVEMYKAARELLGPGSSNGYYRPAGELTVLEISGENFRDLLPWEAYRSVSNVDVCSADDIMAKLDGHGGEFDLVVLDHVLEHVIAPARALAHIRVGLLAPRGRVFVSTPFLIRVHPAPLDLWRWTREGLGELLEAADFNDVQTGSWGNRAAVVANLDGWAIAGPDSDMTNDPLFPVTCWAVGTR